MDRLRVARVAAVENRWDRTLLVAGSFGVRVAVDEPDETRVVGTRRVDMEGDPATLRHGPAVSVAGKLEQWGHSSPRMRKLTARAVIARLVTVMIADRA
jgi:hypothetical protein